MVNDIHSSNNKDVIRSKVIKLENEEKESIEEKSSLEQSGLKNKNDVRQGKLVKIQ